MRQQITRLSTSDVAGIGTVHVIVQSMFCSKPLAARGRVFYSSSLPLAFPWLRPGTGGFGRDSDLITQSNISQFNSSLLSHTV